MTLIVCLYTLRVICLARLVTQPFPGLKILGTDRLSLREIQLLRTTHYELRTKFIMDEKETQQTTNHIDYKDITRLRNYVNPHARMLNRRRTGLAAREQRNFARAIKRARFMALMPYISR